MALQFFLRNICTEILDVCQKENVDCHSNFIFYYLQLLALDPIWNLYPKMKEINRLDAVRLIKFVVTKMKNQHCPCIISLKIHMYFNCNFEDKVITVCIEKVNYKTRLKPLEDELVETITDDKEEIEHFKKKLVFYITLWRGMGNPTDTMVYREAKRVFQSVYDDSDVLSFMQHKREWKEFELVQLSQVCSGIRIFNWSCDKGGYGLDNVPEMLKDVTENMNYCIQVVLGETMDKINYLTTAVDYSFPISEVVEYAGDEITLNYLGTCDIPEGISYEEMEYAKDLIIVYRQFEVLIRILIEETDTVEKEGAELDVKLKETLEQFHSIVYLKVGVPTETVFPVFMELDMIWDEIQDNVIYISKLYQIIQNLQKYLKDLILNNEMLRIILRDRQILTDADRLETDNEINFTPSNTSISVNTVNSTDSEAETVPLEFLGFCVWKLVESQGGLIPGNPNLGVLRYKNKNFAFSSPEAARAFDMNPDKFINEALELARKKTELIPLLQLEDQLKEVQLVKELVVEQKATEEKVVVRHEVDIQTELHPVETKIDDTYMWNMWDWKRQALRLADLSKRKTGSTQTESSSNKNPVRTQTYEFKSKTCQTRHDNYTNVATPQTYFFGLRGRKDNKQFILDLTRPIEERPCVKKEMKDRSKSIDEEDDEPSTNL